MFRRGRVFRLNYTCRVRVPFAGNVTGLYWLWRWCVAGVCTRWRSCCVSCTGNRCGIVASLISANVRSVTASRANRKPPLAATSNRPPPAASAAHDRKRNLCRFSLSISTLNRAAPAPRRTLPLTAVSKRRCSCRLEHTPPSKA